MRLHPVRLVAHHVAETGQRALAVGQTSLVDDSPQEPGEGALLAVTCNILHRAGTRAETLVGPDTCPVVDQDTCQLYTVVKIAHADR